MQAEASGSPVAVGLTRLRDLVESRVFSLFQIMALESWSMGIVRPVMDVYPLAWLFFVPFVIVTSFAVLYLFITLIVNSMPMIHMQDRESATSAEAIAHDEREQLLLEVRALRQDLKRTMELRENG